MGSTYGNYEIISPEDLYFLGFEKTVGPVEIGEMQDKEVIIVVDVDLGALVPALAVLNIQRVKVEIVA
jgi:hypothetical protein